MIMQAAAKAFLRLLVVLLLNGLRTFARMVDGVRTLGVLLFQVRSDAGRLIDTFHLRCSIIVDLSLGV
ncbi:hypothetical protein [Kineococcus indalonis]|uniref:hypothetical protein n=1 Tax=Kineococcus indalonis TaxID=2696566 RepID=UPI001F0DA43B|nr:hypothetical protein [Kineococcus indalonis]